jgi:predicted DNA-binding protein
MSSRLKVKSFKIDPETEKLLLELSSKLGVSEGEVIRRAIRLFSLAHELTALYIKIAYEKPG